MSDRGQSDPHAAEKRAAAEAAASLVESGMVVGLGTGSTASFAIEALIRRHAAGLEFVGIPTSEKSASLAQSGGIRLVGFDTHLKVDLTIDGADEIERGTLSLIKGLGGALLREKIVASASERIVIIADESKVVDRLGSLAPVPVEVTPFGWQATASRLASLGATVTRRRMSDGGDFYTDGRNAILDCQFGPIADAAALETSMRAIVGVIETGLFIGMASMTLVAGPGGITELRPV